ncbi:MAG: hypothetical protein U0167_15315 [bacterium]
MGFEIFLRFNPFDADERVKVLDPAGERFALCFVGAGGKQYERRPYRTGMEELGGRPNRIDLVYGNVGSRSELFMLLSRNGEQIPPGDYLVHVWYENAPEHGARGANREVDADSVSVWKGVVTTAPFPVHVAATEADTTRCELPTRVVFRAWPDGQLTWRWDETSFEPAVIVSRPGYHLGCETVVKRYVGQTVDFGDPQAVTDAFGSSWSWSLGGIPRRNERSESALAGNSGSAVGGKELQAEFNVTIFETSVPGGHMWHPKSGNYRVLRNYKIVQTRP